VLAVALRMPRGFATSLFYIPLILCGLTFQRPGMTFLLAGIAALLSQFSYSFRARAPVEPWMGPAHQIMAVATLLLTAMLVYQHRKSLLRLQVTQERAAFLANIVESTDDAVIGISAAGSIHSWNSGAEKMFGFRAHQRIGQPIGLLFPEFQTVAAGEIEARLHSHIGRRNFEASCSCENGSLLDVVVTASPILDAKGNFIGISEILRDNTETKIMLAQIRKSEAQTLRFQEDLKRQVAERTAQLAASNRELEDFASFASHDLKAPLRGIRAIAGFLEEDLEPHLTPQSRSHMHQMNLRVQRMEKLLDDLLDYARISDPDTVKSGEIISGNVLMQDIIGLLAPPEHFKIGFTGPFAEIQLPRMPLQQVLMNLLGNAIKHHDKPEANICVSVSDAGPAYCFTVADDGPGISKKFHDRAFKMFQTLKPRDQVEGSGMGLAVVRKHIESVGGTLALESEENAGCIFRFTWPKVREGSTSFSEEKEAKRLFESGPEALAS
jgi:two-component system sensor kinase FixL